MKDLGRLLMTLNPEQLKVMEGVLEHRQLTLDSFKLMRKDYSQVKSNVKKIEKKLLKIIEQVGDRDHIPQWIVREVTSIEKKYKDVDHATKKYKQYMSAFNRVITAYNFREFNPHEFYHSPVRTLRSHLSVADTYINQAQDAIRITGRYFKNITSAFQGHARLMEGRKLLAERLRLKEMELAKEAELNRPEPGEENADTYT